MVLRNFLNGFKKNGLGLKNDLRAFSLLNNSQSSCFFLLHSFLSVLGFIIFERNAFDIVPNRESNS